MTVDSYTMTIKRRDIHGYETPYVKELLNKEDLPRAFPVMKQLRTNLVHFCI